MNSMNAIYDPFFWLTISVMLTIFIYASKLVWKSIRAYSPDSIVSQTYKSVDYNSDSIDEPIETTIINETKPETNENRPRKSKKSTPKN